MRALLALLVLIPGIAWGQVPDAKTAFEARQQALIEMASHLGTLHRLRQICDDGPDTDLFRNRMRELVPLEEPMERTREGMIAAFNAAYRQTSADHDFCGASAWDAYRAEAAAATETALRLSDGLPY